MGILWKRKVGYTPEKLATQFPKRTTRMSKRRYHIIFCTYGSWLPGNPRGFRTRHHRLHVEGDYKNPPVPGIYEGLHTYVKEHMRAPAVTIPSSLRPIAGRACLEQFSKEGVDVTVLSVGGQHVHVAVLCSQSGLKQMVGRVKKVSSHRIRDQLPGKVWAGGCKPVLVCDDEHWANVLKYIRNHKDAWVWCTGN